jgi:SAM-dependent methyltransferase
LGVVFDNPSEMSVAERMFLYALVRGSRPRRVLEIGSRHGGSASIIAAAMMDSDPAQHTRVIGIDPGPEITVKPELFYGKFELVIDTSPEGIAAARAKAGGPFDFVLIDGLHIYSQLKKDLDGVLPHLANNTYILLHDAFHLGIASAISELVQARPNLIDCGYPCNKASLSANMPLAYGGFRMLLWNEGRVINAQSLVEKDAAERDLAAPPSDPDLADHDPYWHCRKVKRCAYCIKHNLNAPRVP